MPDSILSPPQALEKALGAYHSGNFSEAERLCAAILKVDKYYVDALHLLAVAQAALGKNDVALDNYDRALAIRPDFADALSNRGNTFCSVPP